MIPEGEEAKDCRFSVALETADYFNAQTIQIDSYTPAIQYKGGRIPPGQVGNSISKNLPIPG
jgi:hypothetical protein